MKKLLFSTVALALLSQAAFADEHGYCNRYATRYDYWDRAVYDTYHYSETTTVTRTCNYYTCYENVSRTDNVWVEERVITDGRYNGHHVVRVYRDSGYHDSDLVATYYVSDTGMIYRRDYYNPGWGPTYYYPGYSVVYTELDAASSAIVAGTYVFVLGAEIIASDPNNVAVDVLGGVLMGAGLASSAFGSSMAMGEATALQNRIDQLKNSGANNASDLR